ncbi:MAG: hypothetical protein EZS28_037011 [Streblomastix strix]|uniref:Uncharacterized protein n=1 Tax=Streblomastix strix TaxID=222440 RepID=A0A5J4UC65_9EUKA|nr:MAG: hypothetical protein EZS28_037011 [Streblomastix strix]
MPAEDTLANFDKQGDIMKLFGTESKKQMREVTKDQKSMESTTSINEQIVRISTISAVTGKMVTQSSFFDRNFSSQDGNQKWFYGNRGKIFETPQDSTVLDIPNIPPQAHKNQQRRVEMEGE